MTNYLNLEKLIELKIKQNKRQLIDSDSNEGFSMYFDEEIIWRALIQSMLALHHLHQKSIMHRDIKPANILINFPHIDTVDRDSDPL